MPLWFFFLHAPGSKADDCFIHSILVGVSVTPWTHSQTKSTYLSLPCDNMCTKSPSDLTIGPSLIHSDAVPLCPCFLSAKRSSSQTAKKNNQWHPHVVWIKMAHRRVVGGFYWAAIPSRCCNAKLGHGWSAKSGRSRVSGTSGLVMIPQCKVQGFVVVCSMIWPLCHRKATFWGHIMLDIC